jgi:hypothetical protein
LAKLAARRHGVFAANNDFQQRYPQKNAAARRRRRSSIKAMVAGMEVAEL